MHKTFRFGHLRKNEHQLINYTEIMFLPIFQGYSITDFQFRFNSVTSIL